MSNQELHDMLARLHAQLQNTGHLESQDRELLRVIAADVARISDPGPDAEAPALTGAEHLPRLESMAVKFESEHPALAGSLRDFMDALGRVGM